MESRLSIIMTLHNRAALLSRSLYAMCRWQTFDPGQAELVLVDDSSDDKKLLLDVVKKYEEFFYRITLITMDKKRSKIPVFFNCPSLGINIGVKAAENEIIYKTDPECLPLTETVNVCLGMYDPDVIRFFSVRILTEKETTEFGEDALANTHPSEIYEKNLVDLPDLWHIDERHRLHYWYGAMFSRSKHMAIGGLDEEFLRGFAGEDDDWAERMHRSGVEWRWSDDLKILHQFHGAENMKMARTPEHYLNINRLLDGRAKVRIVANEGYDWGSDSAIVEKRVFPEPLKSRKISPVSIEKVSPENQIPYWEARNLGVETNPVCVSVNMRVRDEMATIAQSVLSVLPVAEEVLIADTGSTDGTLEIVRALSARHKKIRLFEMNLPSMTHWKKSEDLGKMKRSPELTEARNFLIAESRYPIIWIVDGDEVYPREAIAGIAWFIDNWPPQFICGFLPLIWMDDHLQMAVERDRRRCVSCSGRLFVKGKIAIQGAFPGESARIVEGGGMLTFGHPESVVLDCAPYLHYERMVKPHRRTEEFINSLHLFPGSTVHADHQGENRQQAIVQ